MTAELWGPENISVRQSAEIAIFQEAQGRAWSEVRLELESFRLSLNQMAALFERDKSVISRHLRNV